MTLAAWSTTVVNAVTTGTLPVSQSITSTALGGATPVAVIVETYGATVIGGTATVGARVSIGIATASVHRCLGAILEDNIANTDTGARRSTTTLVEISLIGSTGADGSARLDAFKADGMDILWDDLPVDDYVMVCTFFFGDVIQAHLQTLNNLNTVNGTISTTACPFQPNVLMAFANNAGFPVNPNAYNHARIYTGIAVDNEGTIEQGGVSWWTRDNNNASTTGLIVRDDSIIQRVEVTAADVVTYTTRVEVTSFNSDGWTLTTRDDTDIIATAWLALDMGANRRTVKVSDLNTDTLGTTKIVSSSASGDWEPGMVHALGTDNPVT